MDRRAVESENQEYDSLHGTDHYLTKWDKVEADPGDVYVGKNDEWLQYEYPYNDLGEEYPRGV
jgi:hypothetical protein